jgi:hypothetical protein
MPKDEKPVIPAVPAMRRPAAREAVRTRQQKAEAAEVAGRHANSGQKDHKGAR